MQRLLSASTQMQSVSQETLSMLVQIIIQWWRLSNSPAESNELVMLERAGAWEPTHRS